ncbi:Late embryogenesis abundant protein [Nymphaea thermarum]|nr:Late embryogenesis abundant protein [Nymphaea thermarum]
MASARFFSATSELSAAFISRRNFSATSSGAVVNAVRAGSRQVLQRMEDKSKAVVSGDKTSWMPDPVTGYFIPEDQFGQIDAAQLRQVLLSQRSDGAKKP